MDCLRASEILSAAHDDEFVEAAELAEAHEHCASCAECRALQSVLARLDTLPAPAAPADLVERVVVMGAETAADLRDAAIAARALADRGIPLTPESAEAPGHPAHLLPGWWAPRFTAFAVAAAVIVIALGVGAAGLIGTLGANRVGSEDAMVLESTDTPPADDSAASPPSADAYRAEVAPAYITFDSVVWRLHSSAAVAPSTITTAGVVTSSLEPGDVTDRSITHTAYLSNDGATLWIRADDGSYLVFSRVTRTLGLRPYALTSETILVRFGMWPGLPERFATPDSADGSPAFTYFGFDDLSRDIFIPVAGRVEDGFAVAPGTPEEDPAAGNPNWTWWEPAP
jgi:hypothetical protein